MPFLGGGVMGELVKILGEIKEKIGYNSFILLAFSFMVVAFEKQLGEEVQEKYKLMLIAIGGSLFFLGLIAALLSVFVAYFSNRPARGLLDGLAAASLSGLVGGYFGFGYGVGSPYVEPQYVRIGMCFLFAVPVGGFLGLCLDLVRADRPVEWRKYLSVFIMSSVLLFGSCALGIAYFAPVVDGAGMIYADLLLIFVLYVFFMILIESIQSGWGLARFIRSMFAFIICTAIVYIFSWLVTIEIGHNYWFECERLICMEFQADPENRLVGQENFILSLLGLMSWTIVTFVLSLRINNLNFR